LNGKAVIDLSKLVHNLRVTQNRLQAGVKTLAVIKDNAYGHGIFEVAKSLEKLVDGFCVARVDEGVQLRKAGIGVPILIFEIPDPQKTAAYLVYNLIATVADLSTFKHLKAGTEYHLNFDTGMHRIGLYASQIEAIKTAISDRTDCTPTGIYTHFYKADDPGNPEVKKQLELFKSIRKEFPVEWMTHTANTGAIFHYSDLKLQFDAVRPGVCLYGYGAGEKVIKELQPAMELRSHLVQTKKIKAGETVSYGGTWTAPNDGYLGIIPVGYAAGVPRGLSNKIEVEIVGKTYRQVGIISMDYLQVFLDADHYPIGTEVLIMGEEGQDAKKWAALTGTIPYEITTQINPLLKREYIG
jgi:alanine racemase